MTPARTPLRLVAGLTLASVLSLTAAAQTPDPQKPPAESAPSPASPATPQAPAAPAVGQGRPYTGPMFPTSVHIFTLAATTTQQQQNEILVTIRNIVDPRTKVTLSPSQNTIFLAGTDDQIALAQKIIESLD